MRGTVCPINKALLRPLLIAGVEKRLVILNSVICFPLVAVTHLRLPGGLVGFLLFVIFHSLLTCVSKKDPRLGQLVKRASRYAWQPFFYAKSHPLRWVLGSVKTLPRL